MRYDNNKKTGCALHGQPLLFGMFRARIYTLVCSILNALISAQVVGLCYFGSLGLVLRLQLAREGMCGGVVLQGTCGSSRMPVVLSAKLF